ncbi:unnamed protein product [Closterium sp. NIES-53]
MALLSTYSTGGERGGSPRSVKLWDLSLQPLLEMVGHTALVYSVAATAGGELIASASEDATARVWKDGECMQALEHPSCVWAVAFLPNGDLITASADGAFRIWTRDAARVAPEGLRASYEERVKASRKKKTVGGVNVDELPGIEALQQPVGGVNVDELPGMEALQQPGE